MRTVKGSPGRLAAAASALVRTRADGSAALTLLASLPLLAALTLLVTAPAGAMVFGQYTTAAVAPEGEGAVFMSAGDDVFDMGVNARFRVHDRSDLGFEAGFDRFHGGNALGVSADFKLYLLEPGTTLPVDLAADLAVGHYFGDSTGRTVAGLSLIVSGTLVADTRVPVEPYFSLGFFSYFFDGDRCGSGAPGCGDDSETDTLVRGGARVWLSEEYQVSLEVKVDGRTTVGAAFNVVF